MKFFNWVQGKFNGGGGQATRKQNAVPAPYITKQESQKEEFSDWPNGLLAIGTFGNVKNPAEQEKESSSIDDNHRHHQNKNEHIEEESSLSSPDLTEFTQEEIGHLQKELTKLLTKKPAAKAEAEKFASLPLDRFLNCPSSLEVDRRISGTLSTNSDHEAAIDEEEIDRTIRVILGRCKDVRSMENKNKSIGKKSVSFLLKKMFVCRGGFAPSPSLRDAFQESRMEKLLRTMLSKKINTQNSSRMSTRKFIGDSQRSKPEKEEEKEVEKTDSECKWDKTDSEYIVLEM